METKHKIYLRRIDYFDKKLLLFLFPKHELDRKFNVSKGGIVFEVSLGFMENLPKIHTYTDIEFEAELETNLALFAEEIPLIVDAEHLKIESTESVELNETKEAERIKLEEQLSDLFPIILKVFNTFRSACKVALYKESVAGRILTRNIQDSQIHWGTDVNESLEEYFSGDDTAFLFDAFVNLSLSSFTGDADIEYRVSDGANQVYEGVFKNGYEGLHSPNKFFQRLDEIQNLINVGWSIETEALLISLEFLYSDNYRMAIFNAATVLEFVLVGFWERKQVQLDKGSRKEQEMVARLNRQIKQSDYPTHLEKIIRIVLPEFIAQDFINNGTFERCINAWNIRNGRLAHLYANVRQGSQSEITRIEAWSAVASIIDLVDNVKKSSS